MGGADAELDGTHALPGGEAGQAKGRRRYRDLRPQTFRRLVGGMACCSALVPSRRRRQTILPSLAATLGGALLGSDPLHRLLLLRYRLLLHSCLSHFSSLYLSFRSN